MIPIWRTVINKTVEIIAVLLTLYHGPGDVSGKLIRGGIWDPRPFAAGLASDKHLLEQQKKL